MRTIIALIVVAFLAGCSAGNMTIYSKGYQATYRVSSFKPLNVSKTVDEVDYAEGIKFTYKGGDVMLDNFEKVIFDNTLLHEGSSDACMETGQICPKTKGEQ